MTHSASPAPMPAPMDGRPMLPTSVSPELRLVMCMLASPVARPACGHPADLCAHVSWDGFVAAADEKVRPYLHWASEQEAFRAHVPAVVRNALSATRGATRIRNLRWAAELRRIIAACRDARVPLIVLKGSVLQRTVYPDPSTRPMSDTDLLVQRNDMRQVGPIMTGLGFSRRTTLESHTPNPGLQADEEANFYKTVGDATLLVEIHTRLEMHGLRVVLPSVSPWDRRVEITCSDGLTVPTLDPHTALRHLCLHLAKHNFDYGLMWLLDIRLFLDRHGAAIDWDGFIRESDPQTLPQIAFTLALAGDWLGADVPAGRLAGLLPPRQDLAVTLAWAQMTDQVRTRKPPNAVLSLLSGDPRRMWAYLAGHVRQWTMPIPGSTTSRWVLMARRVWSDMRTFRASFRAGGFRPSNVRTAARGDQRAAQLRAVFKSGPDE